MKFSHIVNVAASLLVVASCSNGRQVIPADEAPSLSEIEKSGISRMDSVNRFSSGFEAELGLPLVYKDSNVVFRKVTDNFHIGSGHVMASETMYLLEGSDSAILIDTGTHIPELRQVVDSLTDKPYKVIITHVHPDHAGSIDAFSDVWINEADTANLRQMFPDHKCSIHYFREGQTFNLGGRILEVVFTPGHTPGSTTFMDKKYGYGFSGDSFGNGNLLLTGTFSTLRESCMKTMEYMVENHIRFLFNGHYFGSNPETLQRLENLKMTSDDVISKKIEGQEIPGGFLGLDRLVMGDGYRISYSSENAK